MTELGRIPAADVKPGSAVRLDAGPAGICVVRIGDDFYAIGDRCSHARVSLSEGDVDVTDRTIECWKHGSAFSLRTGEPQSLPAVKPVPAYSVRVEGDDVVVSDLVATDPVGERA
jgi:3-phenylpropionate/trans-cinnamate dioxygenase ferredoxin component